MLASLARWLARCPAPPRHSTGRYQRVDVGEFGYVKVVPTLGGEWCVSWSQVSRRGYFATEEEAREQAFRVALRLLEEAIGDVRRSLERTGDHAQPGPPCST